MKKKGAMWIALLLFLETVIFIKTKYVFPPAIIAWYEEFMVRFLLYWVIHILFLFFIYKHYFLDVKEVSYRKVLIIMMVFLMIRILYDICMCIYIGDHTMSFYFPLARVCFYSEVGMHLLICLLFLGYAKFTGYKIYFSIADWLKILFFVSGIVICAMGAEFVNRTISDWEALSGKDTVSHGNIISVYLFNLLFEKGIAFLMYSTLFSGVMPKELAAWYQTEEGNYEKKKSAKRMVALLLVAAIGLAFVTGTFILFFL